MQSTELQLLLQHHWIIGTSIQNTALVIGAQVLLKNKIKPPSIIAAHPLVFPHQTPVLAAAGVVEELAPPMVA